MITTRPMRESDIAYLREHAKGDFQWIQGPDFSTGVALVDRDDSPQLIAGAWKRAEVHAIVNPNWGTPQERLEAFNLLHAEMEKELAAQGFREVVTWFTRAEQLLASTQAFFRRLTSIGWVKSERTSWHRAVRGGKHVG